MLTKIESEICSTIAMRFPEYYQHRDSLPLPYKGSKPIKAVVLGADPTYVSGDSEFERVFKLEDVNTPFFAPTKRNIGKIGVDIHSIYVQNCVRNYFRVETSKNPAWDECARLWLDALKQELDNSIDPSVPVLVSSWVVFKAVIASSAIQGIVPRQIYSRCIILNEKDSLLGRQTIGLFRHPAYSLSRDCWTNYRLFLKSRFSC